jgi:uncharacterized damage-inducible protein DinB
MKKISKPLHTEHALYYDAIINKVDEFISVLQQLKNNQIVITKLILGLPEDMLTKSYAENKWSIKDILQHLIDVEIVFLYRAMRFARNDKSPQPFFDENIFAKEAKANLIPIKKLLKEYKTVRQASVVFFNNQSAISLKRMGIASNSSMSVRACVWTICGHELHHLQIIRERYVHNEAMVNHNIY